MLEDGSIVHMSAHRICFLFLEFANFVSCQFRELGFRELGFANFVSVDVLTEERVI